VDSVRSVPSRCSGTSDVRDRHRPLGQDRHWCIGASLPNLLAAIASRTSLRVAPKERVVTLSSDDLWDVPYIHMTGHGNVHFSDQDLERLRRYLRQGGFLHADDNYGMDQSIRRELARLFPDHPLVEVPLNHPILHTLYDVKDYLQVSSINFWRSNSGSVSERGSDSAQVHYRGIQDSKGRLMVLMTHNTDVSDTWEREGESQDYFDLFSPRGYAIGVNVVLYAMTH